MYKRLFYCLPEIFQGKKKKKHTKPILSFAADNAKGKCKKYICMKVNGN